jgi:hypothetical protein
MDDRPPTGPAETAAIAKAEGQRVANAFLEIFGAGARRSEAARTVLDYLGRMAGDGENSYRLYEARDGIGAIAAGIHRDGAKSILNIINRQVLLATTISKIQKQKVTVKKA